MHRFAICLVIAVSLAVAPACDNDCGGPTAPCIVYNLGGTWSGTSTYINAPFTMMLSQTGTTVSGEYRDQLDQGSVSGTITGLSVVLDVNFGDTGIRLTGTIPERDRITGEIFVAVLAGRRFPFEMLR
jgi:hypothetical protein